LFEEADIPPGVLNLLLGQGGTAGQALVAHPGVDLISFTGGLATGEKIMASAAQGVRRVALELGGKNPNIVFDGTDFDTVVDNALTAAFLHSGQVCSAGATASSPSWRPARTGSGWATAWTRTPNAGR
jgi:betaine-aldehyde dehydrogenase